MRIVYLARHRPGEWDEGSSIAYALRQLGHEVIRVREDVAELDLPNARGDFLLFHHYDNLDIIARSPLPKVFWHFDLVDWPDPTLVRRCEARKKWVTAATDLCVAGFLSDGDWANRANSPKLHVFKEGADGRYCGTGTPDGPPIDVLFIGHPHGGIGRESCLAALKDRYGAGFVMAGTHPKEYVWARDLANLVARAKVVICPDSPVTDRYWSNRACVMTGFGGFVLHPKCEGLLAHYDPTEIAYYESRPHMFDLIDYFCRNPAHRRRIAEAGMMRTVSEHTSLHRCRKLIKIVQETL